MAEHPNPKIEERKVKAQAGLGLPGEPVLKPEQEAERKRLDQLARSQFEEAHTEAVIRQIQGHIKEEKEKQAGK